MKYFRRIFYTTQILSKSVANDLRFYRAYDARLKNCESTAVFCEIFNDLFDALNRTTAETGFASYKLYFLSKNVKESRLRIEKFYILYIYNEFVFRNFIVTIIIFCLYVICKYYIYLLIFF